MTEEITNTTEDNDSVQEPEDTAVVDETYDAPAVVQRVIPTFNVGDTVKVHYKIIEGDKERVQPYEGIVIAKKGSGEAKTFTVRRIGVGGVGVERIFPLLSPNIVKVEIIKHGKVRRAKLYYLRDRKGKSATKIKEAKATS